ncbi:hypothetical protein [Porticoccus sp.]|uniref:hypothetical protein n=1 Tax=Porticoccus sp. TaxID=2024853 RepID=UPI0039E3307B
MKENDLKNLASSPANAAGNSSFSDRAMGIVILKLRQKLTPICERPEALVLGVTKWLTPAKSRQIAIDVPASGNYSVFVASQFSNIPGQ